MTSISTLESFNDFHGLSDGGNFRKVPPDWWVVITDVEGSTVAIESGRYKDVNTIGAAAIAVAQHAMGGREFPYVFGGDGATLLIPPADFEPVSSALAGLKKLSKEKFRFHLRVGAVRVEELEGEGATLEVAKFEIGQGRCVAFFRGGGVTVAERKIKGNPEPYEITEADVLPMELKGLSCRWNAIPNKNGKVLSVLVQAKGDRPEETYRSVLQKMEEIFGGDLGEANPVNLPAMYYKTIAECFRDERRYHRPRMTRSFLYRLFEIVMAVLVFKFKVPPPQFSPPHYMESMKTLSDYRKFDDMLRMVIDCSDDQIVEFQQFLSYRHLRGEIDFGLHESDTALMTCYVQDIQDGGHIHFIDGGDGGYAMAARQLKGQSKK